MTIRHESLTKTASLTMKGFGGTWKNKIKPGLPGLPSGVDYQSGIDLLSTSSTVASKAVSTAVTAVAVASTVASTAASTAASIAASKGKKPLPGGCCTIQLQLVFIAFYVIGVLLIAKDKATQRVTIRKRTGTNTYGRYPISNVILSRGICGRCGELLQ